MGVEAPEFELARVGQPDGAVVEIDLGDLDARVDEGQDREDGRHDGDGRDPGPCPTTSRVRGASEPGGDALTSGRGHGVHPWAGLVEARRSARTIETSMHTCGSDEVTSTSGALVIFGSGRTPTPISVQR